MSVTNDPSPIEMPQTIVFFINTKLDPGGSLRRGIWSVVTCSLARGRSLQGAYTIIPNTDTTPIQYRYNTDTTPIQHRYNTIQYRYNTDTTPILHRYNTDTTPIQYRYNTDTTPIQHRYYTIQYRYNTDTIPLPPHIETQTTAINCFKNKKLNKHGLATSPH